MSSFHHEAVCEISAWAEQIVRISHWPAAPVKTLLWYQCFCAWLTSTRLTERLDLRQAKNRGGETKVRLLCWRWFIKTARPVLLLTQKQLWQQQRHSFASVKSHLKSGCEILSTHCALLIRILRFRLNRSLMQCLWLLWLLWLVLAESEVEWRRRLRYYLNSRMSESQARSGELMNHRVSKTMMTINKVHSLQWFNAFYDPVNKNTAAQQALIPHTAIP